MHILLVEDELDLSDLLSIALMKWGAQTHVCPTIASALAYLNGGAQPDLILTDMRLPDGSGIDIVTKAQALNIKIMVMTAYASTEQAIQAMKLGALDYLTKPIELEHIRRRIQELFLSKKHPSSANVHIDIHEFLIGNSASMQTLKQKVQQYAQSLAPVVIFGQTGTGKERVAKAVHYASGRAQQAFVAINCAAIPENLLESELFGFSKGAFSGAHQEKDGLIQTAHQGTLFLDEIAELPLSMQTKLLRVLQERCIRRLGDTKEIAVDVRIICASHQNLAATVARGQFREDLFYRLHVLSLDVPSLADRQEDIPLLVSYILKNLQEKYQKNKKLSTNALQTLEHLHYKGNIRELENILESAYAKADDVIQACHVLDNADEQRARAHLLHKVQSVEAALPSSAPTLIEAFPVDLPNIIANIEKQYILAAKKIYGDKPTLMAKALNLSLRQLRYRMQQLDI